MHKYALIPIEQFNEEMLGGIEYDVNVPQPEQIRHGEKQFRMLEYTDQPDPIGDGWIIFDGDDANVKCAEYLASITFEVGG